MEPMHPVCFRTSDGQRYLIDWRDIEIAMEREPLPLNVEAFHALIAKYQAQESGQ